MVTAPPRLKQRLTEQARFSRPLKVDREAGIIYGAKLLGWTSKNGRRYLPEAGKRAVERGIYEGARGYTDHPSEPEDERAGEEAFCRYFNVRYEPDGLYTDIRFLKSHPMAERICEDAEAGLGNFGLSHNADGETRLEADGTVTVLEIVSVRSVDIVTRPATTQSLSEGVTPIEKTTVRGLFESLSVNPKVPVKTRRKLLEMMDEESPDPIMEQPSMDAEMPMPEAGGDHNAALADGFKAALQALVNEDLKYPEMLKRLKDILKAKDGLLGGSGSAPAEAPAEPAADAEAPVEESCDDDDEDDKMKDMKESVARLKRENATLHLLLEGVAQPSPTTLKALALLESDDDRRALLAETRAVATGAPRSATRGSTPPAVKAPKDSDEFLKSITN